jgi:anthranilate synthase component I
MLAGRVAAAQEPPACASRHRQRQRRSSAASAASALGVPSSLRTDYAEFAAAAATGATLVPLFRRILSDHLTPVLAYRCLVKEDDREAPSFLLESVVNGNTSVRRPSGPAPHTSMPNVCATGGGTPSLTHSSACTGSV